MQKARIPPVLRERLGSESAIALIDMFDSAQESWSDQVLTLASDRFERRLVQEISALRVEFSRELHEGLTAVRHEMAALRVELLKWSFLFWVGQVAVIAGLLSYMLPRS